MDLFFKRNAEVIESVSNFKNDESFNLHMRKVYYTFKDELDGSLKEFVKFLSQYSIKCHGVSWLKPETMSNYFGKSQVTIKRYISKLKKLGIINRVKPKKGSHFITYFTNTVELSDLPSDTPKMIHQKNDETPTGSTDKPVFNEQEARTFKSLGEPKELSNKRYKDVETPASEMANNTPKNLDRSFVPNWVDPEFVETASPFFGDAKTITKLWTKATYAARNLELCGKTEGANAYVDIVIDAFKTTMYEHKRRAVKGSVFGYFYGVVRNKLQEHKDENTLINPSSFNLNNIDPDLVELFNF